MLRVAASVAGTKRAAAIAISASSAVLASSRPAASAASAAGVVPSIARAASCSAIVFSVTSTRLTMEPSAGPPPPLVVKVMRMSAPVLAARSVPVFETSKESGSALGAASGVEAFDPAAWDAVQASYARGSDRVFTEAEPTLRDATYTDHLVLPSSFGTVGACLF